MCTFTQKAVEMTSLSLEDFLLLPARHVRYLAASIEHLLSCPISDVAGDHVTALQRVNAGRYINIIFLIIL